MVCTVAARYMVVKSLSCQSDIISNITSQHIQELLGVYFKITCGIEWLARVKVHNFCDGRVEKFIPHYHQLSSLDKPHDAKL